MPGNAAELWEVMKHYNLKTFNITHHYREVYKVETDQGTKALKVCDRDEMKIFFVFSVMDHVWKKGFYKLSKPEPTSDGRAYVLYGDKVYFLADWVKGRQCDFESLEDLKAACETLAEFHNHSYGLMPPDEAYARSMSEQWMTTFAAQLEDLQNYQSQAASLPTEFAKKYVQNCCYFISLAKEANQILFKSDYLKIAEEAHRKKTFTHRDVAGRNFIMVDKTAYLIDFDYARYDIRLTDVVRILERSLKLHKWSPCVGKKIIDCYNAASPQPLNSSEYRVILAFLTWPQKFWRLSNRYFNSKKPWQEENYLKKLDVILKTASQKAEFICWFKKEYCR